MAFLPKEAAQTAQEFGPAQTQAQAHSGDPKSQPDPSANPVPDPLKTRRHQTRARHVADHHWTARMLTRADDATLTPPDRAPFYAPYARVRRTRLPEALCAPHARAVRVVIVRL